MKEENRVFVVYNQQRWDQVRLIRGFKNKKDAEKLRKSLEKKETRYEEIYCMEEIEIEEKEIFIIGSE